MIKIPAKVKTRLEKEIPVFRRILCNISDRDANEAFTVTVGSDTLEKVFGYLIAALLRLQGNTQLQENSCDLAD